MTCRLEPGVHLEPLATANKYMANFCAAVFYPAGLQEMCHDVTVGLGILQGLGRMGVKPGAENCEFLELNKTLIRGWQCFCLGGIGCMHSSSKIRKFLLLELSIPLMLFCGATCAIAQTAFVQFSPIATATPNSPPPSGRCNPGGLPEPEKQKVLSVLNDIRKLHGLGEVVYDFDSDEQMMQTALMLSMNAQISHEPPTNWKCYSAAGAEGAGSSNLGLAFNQRPRNATGAQSVESALIEDNMIEWLTDVNNSIPNNIGHRRWLLDPFLEKVAYGRAATAVENYRVANGSALKVIYPRTPAAVGTASGDYVAYPVGDYPIKYFANGALFSFSAMPSASSQYANKQVDFSKASIHLRLRGALSVSVKNIVFDNMGFGIANNLQFSVDRIIPNVFYDVSIKGVKVGDSIRDYNYWFRIIP